MEVEYLGAFIRCRDKNLVQDRLLTKELQRIDETIAQSKLLYKMELSAEKRESTRLLAEAARARRRQRKRQIQSWRESQEQAGGNRVDRLDLRTPKQPQMDGGCNTQLFERAPTPPPIQEDMYRHTANFSTFFKLHQISQKQNDLQKIKKKNKNPTTKYKLIPKPKRSKEQSASRRILKQQLKYQEERVNKQPPWIGEPEAIQSIRRHRRAAKDVLEIESKREPIRKLTRELSTISICSKNCSRKQLLEASKPVVSVQDAEEINRNIFCPQVIMKDLEPLASRSNVTNQVLVDYLHKNWERTLSQIDLHKPPDNDKQNLKHRMKQTSMPVISDISPRHKSAVSIRSHRSLEDIPSRLHTSSGVSIHSSDAGSCEHKNEESTIPEIRIQGENDTDEKLNKQADCELTEVH